MWAVFIIGALNDGKPHQVNVSSDDLHLLLERFTEGRSSQLVECRELSV